MRFTSILFAGALAVVAAAQSSDKATSTTSADPVQSSIQACIESCDATDVACLARCNPVPNPNASQVNATNLCIGDCDQGNGSAAETKLYNQCVAECIKDNYYDSKSGTPEPTGSSGGSSSDSATSAVTTASSEATGSSTAKSSSDSPSSTGSSSDSEATGSDSGDDGDSAAPGLYISSGAVLGAVAAALFL
ncbi:hypothetical protein GMORB2_5715 [Geosmithia morbida]|uniref:Uncharacterized protein n=1 Tax=Geosmithia morbida TaxID=1094350 RepID=A0A9P4YY96_9HYPO|nr:uncharacterized protein GMORB2_5715 [Geosmithia morbida]KAF4123999.1 hypothetical protein GMORB2_5715 [Geosmithia morbida]